MPNQTTKNNDIKDDVMIDPAIFSASGGGIEVFAAEGQAEKDNIRLTLYDGSVVQHWYWGNLAFDLKTMKLAKSKIPILDAHDTDRPLGFSVSAIFEDKFILEGKLLKNNERAIQRKAELDDGFPYEASLRFDMAKSKIELVREGEAVEVNGHQLQGPGAVIRKAVIMEGSMCVFGALNNCKTENFENVLERFSERKNTMADAKITLESFEKDNAEVFKQIFEKGKAEGEKTERDIFAELAEVCGKDQELLVECFKEGKTKIEALTMKTAKLEKQRDDALELAKKASEKKEEVDPAKAEFTDEQKKETAATKEDVDKTDDELKADFEASKELQDEFEKPEAYIAYICAVRNGQCRQQAAK